jgi:tetratricopeptide (TPR) repeat protein
MMTRTTIAIALAAALAAPSIAAAQQTPPPAPRPRPAPAPAPLSVVSPAELADDMRLRSFDALSATSLFAQNSAYNSGKDLLGRRDYEQAIARFDRVIAEKDDHVEGALYWKAFAQFRLGRTDDALATIAQLRRDHAQSAYVADARTLEADVRKFAGRPVDPAAIDDDELKILAISGIQRSDPERAVPLLEGVLAATNSLRVKRQALYVLAMSTQPRAQQILLGYAKGAGNPDLQIEAVRYLASSQSKLSPADLVQIYLSARDRGVKLAILGSSGVGLPMSYVFSDGPVAVAPRAFETTVLSYANAPLVYGLDGVRGRPGLLSAQDLWALYEKETDKDLRIQIVSAMAAAQGLDQIGRVIKVEKDADVRRRAIRVLGSIKSDKTGQVLSDLYAADADVDNRRTIIKALAAQQNAEGLIAIARTEKSLTLKTEIVRRLSDLAPKSKIAADYLMEIIKQP